MSQVNATKPSLESRFLNLFNPSPPEHHIITSPDDHRKCLTRKRKISLEDIKDHLTGNKIVGIHSFVTDTEVIHGAIDIDKQGSLDHKDNIDFDWSSLQNQIKYNNLPLCVSASKSGALRTHLFLNKPTNAQLVTDFLQGCRQILGLPEQTEIFPKNKKLRTGKNGTKSKGSSLYLPYGNGKKAWDNRGEINLTEFINRAESKSTELVDGPFCIQLAFASGLREGERDNGLFNVAIWLKKQGRLEEFPEISPTLLQTPFEPGEYDFEEQVVRHTDNYNGYYQCGGCQHAQYCNRKPTQPSNNKKKSMYLIALEFLRNRGGIYYDEHFGTILIDGRQITDPLFGKLQEEFASTFNRDITESKLNQAVKQVADENKINLWKDYLEGLPAWDGINRFKTIAKDLFGQEDKLTEVYLKKWLMGSAVRAYYQIGEETPLVKCMLVLAGEQDIGKSSFLRALVPNLSINKLLFTDTADIKLLSRNRADFFGNCDGVIIAVFAEMVGNRKENVNDLKNLLSSTSAIIRKPYAKYHVDVRVCTIFAGTINPSEYGFLKDTTGNVRFYTIPCRKMCIGESFDLNFIKENREQIWSQVVHSHKQREPHWIDDVELKKLQAQRNKEHTYRSPLAEELLGYLVTPEYHIISNRMYGPTVPKHITVGSREIIN